MNVPSQSTEVNSFQVRETESDVEEMKSKAGMSLTKKDYDWLRKTRYEEQRGRFDTTFVLQHKVYPEKIVELKGATATHACSFIHWKPGQVRVLETRKEEKNEVGVVKPVSTVMSGATSVV